MLKSSLLVFILSISLFGCAHVSDGNPEEIAAAKEIVKNRKQYAKEIIQATNDCIKSATSVTHLTASGNDQEETVIACTESAQKAYGAYSPWFESYLQEWANK